MTAGVAKSGRWAWAAVALVVVIGLVVWGVSLSNRSVDSGGPSASPSSSTSATASGLTDEGSAPNGQESEAPSGFRTPPESSQTAVVPSTSEPSQAAVDAATPSASQAMAMPELPAVDLKSEAQRPDGVTIKLVQIESVKGEAKIPGEVSGPAIRITVLIHNEGDRDLDIGPVVVNGYGGEERAPLEVITLPGGNPVKDGLLKRGEQTQGVYLFTMGDRELADVTFTVDANVGQPAAVFRGDAR